MATLNGQPKVHNCTC